MKEELAREKIQRITLERVKKFIILKGLK